MKIEDFEGLKVGILGMGLEGQAAYRWLRDRMAAPLTVIAEAPLEESVREGLTPGDDVRFGPLDQSGLEGFDVLLRSPGISPYRTELRRAAERGVRLVAPGSLWFAANPAARTICVTGTKGKSTTASLIAHVLVEAGIDAQLAGNIGRPLLACDGLDADWWVIELSSYQLADLTGHAHIAVLLNLDQDHLDWHGGVDAYYRDKLNLVGMLVDDGLLVANWNDAELRRHVADRSGPSWSDPGWFNHPRGIHVRGQQVFDMEARVSGPEAAIPNSLPGPHNLANIAAALTVLKSLGISPIKGLRHAASFSGLSHRLQDVGGDGRVRFINDSIASAPLATVAAVESFPAGLVTLIVGGMDRGLDWTTHIQAIAAMRPAAIIGIPDNGAAIISRFEASGLVPGSALRLAGDLCEAVGLARSLTADGGLILLSPGAPSFPRFRDYRERGEQFARLCRQLIERANK